jgi:integration host factor subunit beta
MTKADIVNNVAKRVALQKNDAEKLVEIVFESILEALNNEDKVELRGFGSFRTRYRKERKGRNPKTGEEIKVPAKRIVYFKPGKELRELVNKS